MEYKYTLAHGAKYNVGDFLIRNRAIDLLKKYAGVTEEELLKTDIVAQELSDDEINRITETDALIIAGGPAIKPNFQDVYPSINRILELDIPVIPLGVGWRGYDESSFEFSHPARQYLQKMFSQIGYGGVRDLPTKRLLEGIGIDNVVLAGCPAWQDLNCTNSSFSNYKNINSIVVTSPQKGDFGYGPQWIYLLYRLAREYPDADKYCSFHHGLKYVPNYKPPHIVAYNYSIASIAKMLGYNILDPSGKPEKLEKYRDIDIHVGYRVHGHIHFIANRQPSFLLCQDGRGTGASESLTTSNSDVTAFNRDSFRDPVDEVLNNLKYNIQNDFEDFSGVDNAISKARGNMVKIINSLP